MALSIVGVTTRWSAEMRAPKSSRVPREPTGLASESRYDRTASYRCEKSWSGLRSVDDSARDSGLIFFVFSMGEGALDFAGTRSHRFWY